MKFSGRADNIDNFLLPQTFGGFTFIVPFLVNLKRFVLDICTALGAKVQYASMHKHLICIKSLTK